MKIKFKLNANDLNAALDVVSIVPPRAVDPKGGAGYLFVIGGDKAKLYSRDNMRVARATVDITDVEGEGAFIYPSNSVSAFRFFEGDSITFEAERKDDGSYLVKYESGSGATAEKTAFDPSLMKTCDKDLEDAKDERRFPVAVLREGITQCSKFLAKPQDAKAEENFKTLQIFDDTKEEWAKGKGHMFAANAVQACYFYCDAFESAGFAIHSQNLSYLTGFLSKGGGEVTFHTGQNMTFVTNDQGHVLGWTHHSKTHGKFSYYALKMDKFVLLVSRTAILNALKYTRSELEAKRDKIRLRWTNTDKTLRFEVAESNSKVQSFPVPCTIVQSEDRDFAINVNIDHLIDLFEGVKSNDAELRICIIPADERRPKETAMFRTLDDFLLDKDGKVLIADPNAEKKPEGSYRCKVTRFMPSKE